MIDWSRIAKLIGMVGSPHDGERLNAARLLQKQLEASSATFADLAARVESGGSGGYVRERVIIKRDKPNPAKSRAVELLNRDRKLNRLTTRERFFLMGICRKSDYTGGDFELNQYEADQLEIITVRLNSTMPKQKTARPKAIPSAMLDSLGLGDTPGAFTGEAPRGRGPMPDARNESTVASDAPLGDDVLDGLGLGTVQGTYVQPPVDHQKNVRERFGGLDLDDDIPF